LPAGADKSDRAADRPRAGRQEAARTGGGGRMLDPAVSKEGPRYVT
jgi:hypothetical protein